MNGRAVMFRRRAVLEALRQRPGMTLHELLQSGSLMAATAHARIPLREATLRNDLRIMEAAGSVRRSPGRETASTPLGGAPPIAWEAAR